MLIIVHVANLIKTYKKCSWKVTILAVCYAEAAEKILGAFFELGLVRSLRDLTKPN